LQDRELNGNEILIYTCNINDELIIGATNYLTWKKLPYFRIRHIFPGKKICLPCH
jgi:hypothetical protein